MWGPLAYQTCGVLHACMTREHHVCRWPGAHKPPAKNLWHCAMCLCAPLCVTALLNGPQEPPPVRALVDCRIKCTASAASELSMLMNPCILDCAVL